MSSRSLACLVLAVVCTLCPRTDAAPKNEMIDVEGRAIDDARIPIGGATVTFRPRGGEVQRTRTGADGRFAIRAGPLEDKYRRHTPSGGLLIQKQSKDGAWRAAVAHVSFSPHLRVHRHVGHLVLQPARYVTVRVRDGTQAVPGGRVLVRQFPYGDSAVAEAELDADGSARVGPLPDGQYELFAVVGGYRRGHAELLLNADTATAEIVLTPARDVAIRIVDGETKVGVPGAVVEAFDPRGASDRLRVPPTSIERTNAKGRTLLSGAGSAKKLRLRVRAPGYVQHAFMLAPNQRDVTFELTRGTTTLRWKLEDPAAAPPEGTRLRVIPAWESYAAPQEATIKDGYIVVPGWMRRSGLGDVAAPDGSVADLRYDMIPKAGADPASRVAFDLRYVPTRFVAPRTLQFRLVEQDGTPAANRWIALKGAEFFFDGEDRPARGVPANGRTDRDGRVSFKGIYRGEITVRLLAAGTEHHELVLGTIPLERIGGDVVTMTLPPRRPVHLTLLEEGRPRLPADLTVSFDGQTVVGIQEDPIAGTLAFDVRHADLEVTESLIVTGAGATQGVDVDLSQQIPVVAKLELKPRIHCSIHLRVLPGGLYNFIPHHVQLHRLDAETGAWKNVWQPGSVPPPPGQPANEHTIGNLRPGRYRAVDGESGLFSETIEIGPEQRKRLLEFDRTKTRTLRGRVTLPEGIKAYEARIDVEGAAPDLNWRWRAHPAPAPRRVSKGPLELVVPDGIPLVVHLSHPLLSRTSVELPATGTPDLELAPARRATARIDLDKKPDLRFENPGAPRYSGAPYRYRKAREICRVLGRTAEGEAWRELPILFDPHWEDFDLAADEGQTFELWLDLPGWAPMRVADVTPRRDRPPTIPVRLDKGTSVQVNFDLPEGAQLKWMRVTITAEAEPAYRRKARGEYIDPSWNRLRGMYEFVKGGLQVDGLGAGRHRVEASVGFMLGGRMRTLGRTRTIEVDGRTDTQVVFPVR